MPDKPLQEVFQQSLSSSNGRGIFFGLGLTFDGVLGQRLF
jgi:hypothetical protein